MPQGLQSLRGQPLTFHSHIKMMQPGGYSEGHGTVYDPHISGTLKRNARYITLQGRQQRCHLLWNYWGKARLTPSTGSQVVFCNHACHLIPEARGLLWQHIQVEMHDYSTGHIVVSSRLLCSMLIELRDGGVPPLFVLEREGKQLREPP